MRDRDTKDIDHIGCVRRNGFGKVADAFVPEDVVVLLLAQLARACGHLLVIHAVVRHAARQAQRPVQRLHAQGVLAQRIACNSHVKVRVSMLRAVRHHLLVQFDSLADLIDLPPLGGLTV